MKKCRTCKIKLNKKTWLPWRKKNRSLICIACDRAEYAEWYAVNKAGVSKRQKEYRQFLKEEFVKAYGGACTCCGEKEIKFLTVQHINRDGAKHKKEIGGSSRLHTWIKKQGYPKEFTVLCFNCNAADFYYGQCPHKSSSGLEKES